MNDPTAETWRPVVGYEGHYEVSDQGRVRSLRRIARRGGGLTPRTVRERIMRITPTGTHAKVRLNRDGVGATRNVHTLVLEAFVGPCPPGLEACHDDGNGHNNALSNLRYDTRSENNHDRIRHSGGARPACDRGHLYTPENTYLRGDGVRICRTCDRARTRRRWQRKKAA